jgi:hypothetical protein
VVFTVTHDRDMSGLARRGANLTLFVEMRDPDRGRNLPRRFSTPLETLSPVIESSFDHLWDRTVVRDLARWRRRVSGPA